MARPKKDNKNEQATVKIENAFWNLLEATPYSEITVLRISQESETNRNSFYYHYKDIDDLAFKAFRNNADSGTTTTLFSRLLAALNDPAEAGVLQFDPELLPHAKRVMLCAGSDSPFLNHMVRDLLKETWFASFSIDEELLSEEEQLQTDFIFAGLTAVLGNQRVHGNPLIMAKLSGSEIGKTTVRTMRGIARKQYSISHPGA